MTVTNLPQPPHDPEKGRERLRQALADSTKPRLDYFTAKHLIAEILAMVVDEEFEDLLEFDTGLDGNLFAKSPEGHIGYGIGCTTTLTATGEVPTMANYRDRAVEQALDLEAVHRAEVAHWRARQDSVIRSVFGDKAADQAAQADGGAE